LTQLGRGKVPGESLTRAVELSLDAELDKTLGVKR
jgi:hypothetical protein